MIQMENIQHAAEVIKDAEVILIGAGAGMGVDSGLPDSRGNEGFWRAYPVFATWVWDFSSWPIRAGSLMTQRWHRAFTVTA